MDEQEQHILPTMGTVPGYSSFLIADYLITRSNQLTPLHILKFAYISHGYTLAIYNQPLVADRVEAWKHGPVIPSLYHMLKNYGNGIVNQLFYCGTYTNDSEIGDRIKFLEKSIDVRYRKIIDRVLEKYGKYTAWDLSELTHKNGTPWSKYYRKNEFFVEIPQDAIKEHYVQILDYNETKKQQNH